MSIEEQIEELRLQLIDVVKEQKFNLQHPYVIAVSQMLDTLINQYHSKTTSDSELLLPLRLITSSYVKSKKEKSHLQPRPQEVNLWHRWG